MFAGQPLVAAVPGGAVGVGVRVRGQRLHESERCVYFRYQEVHSIPGDLARFSNQWVNVEKQLKVDKVYLETTRNAQLASEGRWKR